MYTQEGEGRQREAQEGAGRRRKRRRHRDVGERARGQHGVRLGCTMVVGKGAGQELERRGRIHCECDAIVLTHYDDTPLFHD